MKCWRLKTINPNGKIDIDYYNDLKLALHLAKVWTNMFDCRCSLTYKDWR